MSSFYDIHGKAIERAWRYASRPGDCFRIIMLEPLKVLSQVGMDERATMVTFRRLPEGQYELAGDSDRNAVADWNKRHKHTPKEAWELPEGLFDGHV